MTPYFFPTYINTITFSNKVSNELQYTTNSGTSAIQVLLRSFNLEPNSVVAIPAYVCPAVKQSVLNENLSPYFLDLKNDDNFWTEYDEKKLLQANVKVIVLVHLYGFIHPDTEKINSFCKQHNIYLIHDAAQSYGINENLLQEGSGIVYSFGPGKATTAAGGGWIKTKKNIHYTSQVKKTNNSFVIKEKYFLKTRIYNYKISKAETFLNKIADKFLKETSDIYEMSAYQKKAASYGLLHLNEASTSRKRNYLLLTDKIKNNQKIKIAYDDKQGSYFKAVLYIKNNPYNFKNHLSKHNIPYFSLFNEEQKKYNDSSILPIFNKVAGSFVEISTEACIPQTEIERVASVIAAY